MKANLLFMPLVAAGILCSCKESKRVNVEVSETVALPVEEGSESASSSGETKSWPPSSETVEADLLKENYLVVLDDSGSMAGEKIKQAKMALLSLAATLPLEHNLGLVLLNSRKVVPLQSGNREDFIGAVRSTKASGGTPLRSVTTNAYKLITKKASAQRGYGNYHMIIVTDGESGDGSPMPLVKAMVGQTAIQVHVIGFHVDNHEMNQPTLVDYRTAGNAQELTRAFEAVTAEAEEFSDPREFTR